jgi:hypothetical protein
VYKVCLELAQMDESIANQCRALECSVK